MKQDLFMKKLWFAALKTRGEQRERDLKEAGDTQREKKLTPDDDRWQKREILSPSSLPVDISHKVTFAMPPATTILRSSAPEWAPIARGFVENGVCLLRKTTEEEARDDGNEDAVLETLAEFALARLSRLRKAAEAAGVGGEDTRLKAAELVSNNTAVHICRCTTGGSAALID
jgi:hypothetical protein